MNVNTRKRFSMGKMAKKIEYSRGDTILKIGKISHFAKATASQNG